MENQVVELAQASEINGLFRPSPLPQKTIEVKLNVRSGGVVLDSFVKEMCSQFRLYSASNTEPITETEFAEYCEFLIAWRVAYVQGLRCKMPHPRTGLAVPAMISQLCKQIGIVHIVDAAVEVVPILENSWIKDDATVVSKLENAHSTSTKFRFFAERLGMEYAPGLSTDKAGGYDFMLFQVVNNQIVTPNPDAAGIVALLAAVTENMCTRTIFAPIVSYGTLDEARMLIKILASPKTKQ